MEPDPANIEGSVVRKHSFNHQINWSHVVLGAAVIYGAWKVGNQLDRGESSADRDLDRDDLDEPEATFIPIDRDGGD